MTGSNTVALDSLHSQKLTILAFVFTVNGFLLSAVNGGKSTDFKVLLLLIVAALHNAS